MSRLFLKIWISLWLVIVLVVVISVGLFQFLRSTTSQQFNPQHEQLEYYAQALEKALTHGEDSTDWISRISPEQPHIYLIDASGRDLLNRELPLSPQPAAGRPDFGRPYLNTTRRIATEGHSDLTLAWAEAAPLPFHRKFAGGIMIAVGFLLSGLASILLTRYIATPLQRLKDASDLVAQGDFSSNVGDTIGGRRDVIGELAMRFDAMSKSLHQARAHQRTLFRDISHELRTPLTRLNLSLDLLQKKRF